MIKIIKKFFKYIDLFAVPFSFRYKKDNTYSTLLGGIVSFIFSLVSVGFGIYYFIPFCQRKNFSINFYTISMPHTEQIRLNESKAAVAFGFECPADKNGTRVEDLLQIEVKYYTYKKDKNGKKKKEYKIIPTHTCNATDFYNEYSDSIKLVNISNFQCLDNKNETIQGIYTDEKFNYYEFSVFSKEDSISHYKRIDEYLLNIDCKVELYYTEISNDFNNYTHPIKPFLNEVFLQLNPEIYLKMNTFFMNQYFEDDKKLFLVFKDKDPIPQKLFSRTEHYFLYKGLNRGENKPTDYKYYAKIYIRADTKKIQIKRKYQNVMEFYADTSSLWLALFYLLTFVFNLYNNFFANHSIEKKLFLFKQVENKHFNISKQNEKINKIISDTNKFKKSQSCNPITENFQNNNNNNNNYSMDIIKIKNINIMNIHNQINIQNIQNTEPSINSIDQIENQNHLKKVSNNQLNYEINKNNIKESCHENENENEEKFLKFSFNILDFICLPFFKCFKCFNKMKFKRKIFLKANDIIDNTLDIIFYIKQMNLLDVINQILKYDNKRGIIKFLSTPIIFEEKNEKEEKIKNNDQYNEHYCDNDIDILNEDISKLDEKTELKENDRKLICLVNERLNMLLK